MKRIFITLIILFIASHYFYSLNAQNKDEKKKEKKIVIKIDKEENGKITIVDTTFILKEGEDPSAVLEKYGIKGHKKMKHTKTFDIEIDDCDTAKMHKKEKMVWVTVGDENDSEKHKTQTIIITDDGEGDVMHMENGNVMIFKEKDGKKLKHTKEFNKKMKGDSMIWEERITIDDENDMTPHKVYKFKHDISGSDDVLIFTDGDDIHTDHFMMRNDVDDNDSVIVIVKKYKNGKEFQDTKKVVKTKKEKKVMIKVLDLEKEDLAVLKIKDNYKKLDVNNFNINLINEKMTLSFEIKEKANTSIKLIDKDGKTPFVEDLKQFQGKYSKEIEAIKGEYYLQINQGNKYFNRKVVLDF